MIFVSGASGRPAVGIFHRVALLGALLGLAGCAGDRATMPAAPAPTAAAAVPQDPVGQFLATASPGQWGSVVLADGHAAQVQVVRAYAAASGRECREVIVGSGGGGRASLLCQSDGQWVAARPLLLGGGAARP